MSRSVVEDIRGVYIYNDSTSTAVNVPYTLKNKPIGTITVQYSRKVLPSQAETTRTVSLTYGQTYSATELNYNGDRIITFKKPKAEKMMIKGVSITYDTDDMYAFEADKSKVKIKASEDAVNTILTSIKEETVSKTISNIQVAAGDSWLTTFEINHSVDRMLGITGFSLHELVSGSDSQCGVMALSHLTVYHTTAAHGGGKELIQLRFANTSNRTVNVTSVSVTYKYLDLE